MTRGVNLRKLTGTAVLVIAALGLWTGTAHAAPATTAPVTLQQAGINYEGHRDGQSIVTSIDAGQYRVAKAGDAVEVLDDAGTVVAAVPLTIKIGEQVYPIDFSIAERTLRLTPQVPADVVNSVKLADIASDGPETQQERDDVAVADFSTFLGYATLIGGLIFGLIFGVIGLVVAGPVGVMAGFGAGGLIGTIVVGGIALVVLGTQYLITVNTPFVPPVPEG